MDRPVLRIKGDIAKLRTIKRRSVNQPKQTPEFRAGPTVRTQGRYRWR